MVRFAVSSYSEVGLVRKNNQDSGYVSPRLLMVADGMGGAAAGDLASSVAVSCLADLDRRLTDAPVSGDALVAALRGALEDTNAALAALVSEDPNLEGMGTTVSGVALDEGDRVLAVNIGDSRTYLLRDGALSRLTHDHSWVQSLVDEGRITEEQALEHPHRSLIMRVLNGNPTHQPEFTPVELRDGDRLLICTDGLCGLVTDAAIATRVTNPDRELAVAALVDLAHEAGGHDNITIILADIAFSDASAAASAAAPDPTGEVLGAARTNVVPHRSEPTVPIPRGVAGGLALSAEEQRYAPRSRRRRGLRAAIGVLVPLLLMLAGGAGFYAFAQTQFYLGAQNPQLGSSDDTTVAIFQGLPDEVLGRPLSRVVETSEVRLGDLPPLYAQRVRDVLHVEGLADGRAKLDQYKGYAQRCVAQRAARATATAAPSPTPTPTVTPAPPSPAAPSAPGAQPTPGASTTGGPTAPPIPTPSVAEPTTPEDC